MNSYTDEIKGIKHLIEKLLLGILTPSDFRTKIVNYSNTKLITLFRDTFPNFSSILKDKIANLFAIYFLNANRKKDGNLFWKFVDSKDFFSELKNFHDNIYERSMKQREIEAFFNERINSELRFNQLEKRILNEIKEMIDSNKTIVYQNIAKKLNITSKHVTLALQNLRKKGVKLGGIINWNAIGINEIFSFESKGGIDDSVIYENSLYLFPKLKLRYIIKDGEIDKKTAFIIQRRKRITNLNIIFNKTHISELLNYPKFERNMVKKEIYQDIPIQQLKKISKKVKNYGIDLLINCENDFKHPNFKTVAKKNDISVRTLIRLKNQLLNQKILKPHIFIDNKEFLQLIISSKHELKFLDKIAPIVESYQVKSFSGEVFWITCISVWRDDIETLYSQYNSRLEMYLVTKKKSKYKQIQETGYIIDK